MKRRKILSGACMHIYQRSINGFNIFYEEEDYILFYTILAVTARKYNIVMLEFCMMINHVHILLADCNRFICSFMRDIFSIYACEFNQSCGRSGQLFHKSFGSAIKKDDKRIRNTIIYIGNNPVEKGMCTFAEEHKWGFLAYIGNRHPFSEEIPVRYCSEKLRQAYNEVKQNVALNKIMHYGQIRRLYKGLSEKEKAMLTDYIISSYYPFDDQSLIEYFGNAEKMMTAIHSSTGAEYEIKEAYDHETDTIYERFISIIKEKCKYTSVKRVITLPLDEKMRLADILQKHTGASTRQICRFLHINTENH